MSIYKVSVSSCDGNRIGRTWREFFYRKKYNATNKLKDLISRYKGEFVKGKVGIEDREGYVNWQYNVFIELNKVEVED